MGWQQFERFIAELLGIDGARIVPGSGNGKSEEDVVGISTISQCKFSESKNTSILDRDVKRLTSAATLQEKLPLFFTESGGNFMLTIPSNPDTHTMGEVVDLIVALALLEKMTRELEECKTLDQFNVLQKIMENTTERAVHRVDLAVNAKFKRIKKKFDTLYDDLTQHDLFEELH